jgi:hypothetical protein
MSTSYRPHFDALDEPTQQAILDRLNGGCRARRCTSTPDSVARDIRRTRARKPHRLPRAVWR